jgi:hypothetical protein
MLKETLPDVRLVQFRPGPKLGSNDFLFGSKAFIAHPSKEEGDRVKRTGRKKIVALLIFKSLRRTRDD